MTKINKIVMHGFKSFAKRTEIIFDEAFNCILGPNGSGKSNVLDALCFVLGKSSAKGLRAEKSSNLVYNGGKKKDPAKQGEVSIYFDNSKKEFPSDDKVVKITRIVKLDGTSRYKINDKTRTRQQILDLMAIAKINPDGYNIILQGDIIKFIEMSPVEKRKIIEEISGISVYEEKKDKAMRELERVENKLGEAQIILKERKGYLKDLKSDRDQAFKYKELNDKIKQNQATYLKLQIDKKEKKKKSLDAKIKKNRDEFNKLQQNTKKDKENIAKKRKEIEDIAHEVEEKGGKNQVKLQKEIEDLRVLIATKKTKIESFKQEIARISTRKEQINEDVKEIKSKISDLDEQIKTLDERNKRRKAERDELEKKISQFKKKHKLGSDTDHIDKQIEELDEKSEAKQKEIQKLREKQQELLREQDRVEFQISNMDEQVRKVKEIEKEHQKEVDELQNKRKTFKRATIALNLELEKSSTLAAEIKNCERKLHELREEQSRLEVRNAQIKESISGSIAVKKILDMKKKEKGIYGTVAELGEVNSKYSLALEVAAGPRIRSIVVEDDAVAAKCIKYLKKNMLGTATFLPLNKIRSPDNKIVSKYKNVSGCHGEAVKLISYDPKFKKIFSYVFGSTIIVDNIDVARRIGVGTVRMATLTGDLVETSGSMHGGYRKKEKGSGGFKEKELTGELTKIESRISELEGALSAYMSERNENEEKIVRLREEKAELEGDIIRTEKSLHLKSDDLDATLNSKSHLEENLKSIKENLKKVMDELSKENRSLASMKVERQKLRTKITTMKNPRLLAELNTFEEKKRELAEEVMSIEAQLKGLNSQKEDIFDRDRENSIKIIKEIEKEEKSFESQIKDTEKEIKSEEGNLKKKLNEQDKIYKEHKTLFAKRNKLNDEIGKLEVNAMKNEESSRQVEYQINNLQLEETKINTELSALIEDYKEYEGVALLTNKSEEDLKKEIRDFEKLKENIGSVNLRALDIYENVQTEYENLLKKHETLSKEREDVVSLISDIEGKKKELFMKTFEGINENFKRIFSVLFQKGKAYLEVENKDNPFEAGMIVRVKLGGSKFMDLRSLSGGEKTLTALAFIFAIQEYEPATFYVMDEVDAALDKRNSETLAKLLRQYSEKAQYVIITHNDSLISEGTSLYGVSMDENGVSKIVSLKV